MTSTSLYRRIHVLVLRGDQFPASNGPHDSVPPEAILRATPGVEVTVETVAANEAVQVARNVRPDVILVDGFRVDPASIVAELDEALSATPALVLFDEPEQELIHACVVAGARGCLTRPLDREALVATIQQVHEKASRRRQLLAEQSDSGQTSGRLIAVRGAKGGVGTTAIASNLAVAIKRSTAQPTALVDGHFISGDIPVALNMTPNRSVADLLPHLDRLDDDLLNATVMHHVSGVAVLAAPQEFEQAELIRSNEYRQVLDALRARYACVVVDCSPSLDQNSITALDMADTVLLVTTPEIAALKNAARLVQLGARLGYSEHKLRLLLNRFNLAGAISVADFDEHMKYRTSFRIPNDAAVGYALTRGEPVVTPRLSSAAARAFDRLARAVISNQGWEHDARLERRSGLSRLAQWRPFARGQSRAEMLEAA